MKNRGRSDGKEGQDGLFSCFMNLLKKVKENYYKAQNLPLKPAVF